MQNYNPMDTLITKGECQSLEMYLKTLKEKNKMAKVPYFSVTGSLIYTAMCT